MDRPPLHFSFPTPRQTRIPTTSCPYRVRDRAAQHLPCRRAPCDAPSCPSLNHRGFFVGRRGRGSCQFRRGGARPRQRAIGGQRRRRLSARLGKGGASPVVCITGTAGFPPGVAGEGKGHRPDQLNTSARAASKPPRPQARFHRARVQATVAPATPVHSRRRSHPRGGSASRSRCQRCSAPREARTSLYSLPLW